MIRPVSAATLSAYDPLRGMLVGRGRDTSVSAPAEKRDVNHTPQSRGSINIPGRTNLAPAGTNTPPSDTTSSTTTPTGISEPTAAQPTGEAENSDNETAQSGQTTKSISGEELSQEEQRIVAELKVRDREVRAHEMAHMAAAGGYARSGASFSYQTGPDGHRYAVGGEVSIDMSAESTPEATIIKAQIIRRAALAPAEPSGQDRAVANAATRMEASARQALRQESMTEVRSARSESVKTETTSVESTSTETTPTETTKTETTSATVGEQPSSLSTAPANGYGMAARGYQTAQESRTGSRIDIAV